MQRQNNKTAIKAHFGRLKKGIVKEIVDHLCNKMWIVHESPVSYLPRIFIIEV